VKIGKNTTIENSAILDMTIIGEKAEVQNSIIGRHTTVRSTKREKTKICKVSVVADDVIIEEGCCLEATKIYPHQHAKGNFQNQTLLTA
jgi:NDP-sugar pyrophosphorylase family protein